METTTRKEKHAESEQSKTEKQLCGYAPDYEFWVRQDLWKLDEAAALIIGVDPKKWDKCTDTIINNYKDLLATMIRSEVAERLEMVLPSHISENNIYSYGSLSPNAALNFAIKKAFKLPNSLISTLEHLNVQLNNPMKTQPYLDEANKYYSRDLAVAVDAWMELFYKGKFKEGKKAPKAQIHSWLSMNHPKIPLAARERIATLINPKKSGGAPKSQEN